MPKRKIYFRADGNTDIGLGHVIRCLALADILKDDFECVFATRFVNKYINEEIEKTCSSYIKLNEHNNQHFEDFLTVIDKEDTVVLDNYFFTTEYQIKIKNIGCKLVCIDDMHDKHYVADAVINHSPGLTEDQFSVETYTKLCLGLDYALLRKPFLNVIPRKRTELKRCLICMGGADKYNITTNIICLLEDVKSIKTIDVIIGSAFLFKDELENAIDKSEKEVNIFFNLSSGDMVERMQIADFGILPASSVSIEAMAVGMPFMVGYSVSNQEEFYYNLIRKHSMFGLGNLLNLDSLLINGFNNKNSSLKKITSQCLITLFHNYGL
jgi:UDP-2,4-diacetamido-2,4,6-trideoxy-beta-L-altropyranose hydrolase